MDPSEDPSADFDKLYRDDTIRRTGEGKILVQEREKVAKMSI
jgi:hypothetical protein